MAAELSTLASSFLDTEPENYALFLLDCIDAKQNLNGDVSRLFQTPVFLC